MTKPLMNLDEVQFDDVEENGIFTSSRGQHRAAHRCAPAGLQPDGASAGQDAVSRSTRIARRRRCS